MTAIKPGINQGEGGLGGGVVGEFWPEVGVQYDTGKTLDGKPVYRETFILAIQANSVDLVLSLAGSFSTLNIVSVLGWVISGVDFSIHTLPRSDINGGTSGVEVFTPVGFSTVVVRTHATGRFQDGRLILEYTVNL